MAKTFHITAPDGHVLEITGPDDATEEQALAQAQAQYKPGGDPNAAIKAQQAAKYPTAAEGGSPNLPWYAGFFSQKPDVNRTPTQVMQDQAATAVKGVPEAVTGIPGALSGAAQAVLEMMTGNVSGKGLSMVKAAAAPVTTPLRGAAALVAPNSVTAPTDEESANAAEGAGTMLGAGLLGAGLKGAAPKFANAFDELKARFPSKATAGAKFQRVMDAARDVPLDLSKADDVLARAQELRQRGSTMPKVLNDFGKARKPGDFMGVPVDPGMTYEVGRDFSSNASALSAREVTGMNAKMQGQVSQFARALKDANREAAASVGMGDLYDQAMKEYAQASNFAESVQIATKWAKRAAILWGAKKLLLDGHAAGAIHQILGE